ncbi:GAF domain-containing protein [bacterium]|nr:GAF domain-containing protein [bacterium]
MLEPRTPHNEDQRIETLLKLKILDTPETDRYDRYTRICNQLFGTPIAVISLVDRYRQWFKSVCGLDAKETPRNISFCGHAILAGDVFEISDATKDSRFRDNPLVTGRPNIRFYAGAPLKAPNGHNLGTLCIIDRRPRSLNIEETILLKNLADMIVEDMVRFIDLSTGLENRNALIETCKHYKNEQDSELKLSLALFDTNEMFNVLATGKMRNRWCENFAKQLRSLFPETKLVAHLGGNHFAALLESKNPFRQSNRLNHLYASPGVALESEGCGALFPDFVGCIDYNRNDYASAEDLVRFIDKKFFGKQRDQVSEREVAN